MLIENPVYVLQGSMIGREQHNGPQGGGINENVCFSENTIDRHAVAYASTAGSHSHFGENVSPMLTARDYKAPQITCTSDGETVTAVRYITPCECAALQGFPKDYASHTATENPSDEDMAFWRAVFDDYCRINGIKPKTDSQIRKWLKNPHTDSAEYKMWGNGMAKPCVDFVLESILHQLESEDQA